MLADDGRLHLLLASAFGEARPLQGERASESEKFVMQRDEDRREADARRQQHADQHRRDEHDRGADAVQIRRRRAIELLPEVTTRGNQRPAHPHFAECEIAQRRRGYGENDEAERFRLQVFDLFRPQAVPPHHEQRARKEQRGEAEKADENPGDGGAVIADPVGDDAVRGGVERGGVVGMVSEERERKGNAGRQDDDPDQLPSPSAPGKLQQFHHTPITLSAIAESSRKMRERQRSTSAASSPSYPSRYSRCRMSSYSECRFSHAATYAHCGMTRRFAPRAYAIASATSLPATPFPSAAFGTSVCVKVISSPSMMYSTKASPPS